MEPETTVVAPRARKDDPVAGMMIMALLLSLIVALVSIGLLLWYASQRHDAPRSEAERKLTMAETAVKTDPKTVQNWAMLATAQAQVGKFREAEASIAKGRAVQDASLLAVVYADIASIEGDKGEAIVRYEAAKKKALTEFKQRQQKLKAAGVVWGDQKNSAYVSACVGEGQVQLSLGHYKEAKAEFDAALKLDGTMADVLVLRGNASTKLGDKAGAKRDYEQALRFMPNMPEAVAGMRDLEKGR